MRFFFVGGMRWKWLLWSYNDLLFVSVVLALQQNLQTYHLQLQEEHSRPTDQGYFKAADAMLCNSGGPQLWHYNTAKGAVSVMLCSFALALSMFFGSDVSVVGRAYVMFFGSDDSAVGRAYERQIGSNNNIYLFMTSA
jgi:hypothetical protein